MTTRPDDLDIYIGIGLGLDLPVSEIATRIDRDEATVHRRRQIKTQFIDTVRAFTAAVAASTVERRLKEIESKADLKEKLSATAYKKLQRLLDRDADDHLTLAALKEALDRTEGKALDRKAILSKHEETITHQLSDETVRRIASFMDKPAHQNLLPAQEPKAVITVEPQPAN